MDKTHFNTLLLSQSDKIYFYLYGILNDQEDTYEVLLATMLKSWEDRKSLSESGFTKVLRIGRNFAKKKLAERSANTHGETCNCFETDDVLQQCFCVLTSNLSPIQSEIMCLRSIAALSLDEISLVVDMGLNNIQSILANVRQQLRKLIDAKFECEEDNELLQHYYNGCSSIKEEEQLRLYFLREELHNVSAGDRELFQIFLKIAQAEMPEHFSKQLKVELRKKQERSNFWFKRFFQSKS